MSDTVKCARTPQIEWHKLTEIDKDLFVYASLVESNLEKEVILIVLGISEGTIKREDVYKDAVSVGEFLKVNSQKVTSLHINGDDYTRSYYQNDLEDDFFKIETNKKINRINDGFIVNYIATFKGLSSVKLNNIPDISIGLRPKRSDSRPQMGAKINCIRE